jgi:hypothetical protein
MTILNFHHFTASRPLPNQSRNYHQNPDQHFPHFHPPIFKILPFPLIPPPHPHFPHTLYSAHTDYTISKTHPETPNRQSPSLPSTDTHWP